MGIQYLLLKNFRNHRDYELRVDGKSVLLLGANGAGKTSILESISLLTPGKGIRTAMLKNIVTANSNDVYGAELAVHCEINSSDGESTRLGYSFQSKSGRRKNVINENPARSMVGALGVAKIVWLSPDLDRILSDKKTDRRKFFDRITYNFFPYHASAIIAYDKTLRERKLLLKNNGDALWLNQLEQRLAELSANIIQNRTKALEILQNGVKDTVKPCTLKMTGAIEADYLAAEADFISRACAGFKNSRAADKASGRNLYGVHRADIVVIDNKTGLPAALCSTGEQKLLLISIMIAHVRALVSDFFSSAIFLLDDVFSYLDEDSVRLLISELKSCNAQIWLTAQTHPPSWSQDKYEDFVTISI